MALYIMYMAVRLIEMDRLLKNTGSIYLHCDPTASHYLKLVMDSIFGFRNFRNDISWCYTGPQRIINITQESTTAYCFMQKAKMFLIKIPLELIPNGMNWADTAMSKLQELT